MILSSSWGVKFIIKQAKSVRVHVYIPYNGLMKKAKVTVK